MIENINSTRFYEVIKQGCCVVDFSASWCPDCRHIEPMLEILDKEFAGKVSIYKISFDTESTLKNELNIRKIPTLIFYKNAKEVGERLIEPRSIDSIRAAFNALIS
ncbi:thioredoxin [Helicobacter jaachi]|uniref:Thioredoxin n=1 Tax=Helicobacter jaachi TaxID=1677920 RepID=A0A4U8TBF5_9HELI|nr:thioredoxin family protein [Helicobacter jaachi]TLD97260.1 thioredoxin [Helicobacter jaachi]